MIRFFIIAYLTFAMYSCKQSSAESKAKSEYDEIVTAAQVKKMTDSLVGNVMKNVAVGDTSNVHTAPVKILRAVFVKREYSSYKNVSLTYKNISDKKIEAVKFKWYGVDAFNEPADMGTAFDGVGGGYDDDGLRPGKVKSGTWSVMSRNGKKILNAWPYEVVFSDGTKWKAGDD